MSGGYHPSMLNAIQMAVQTSNVLAIDNPFCNKIDFRDAFRLATLGGAEGENIKLRFFIMIFGKIIHLSDTCKLYP